MYKIIAIDYYEASSPDYLSFGKGQMFYVLNYNEEEDRFFVSNHHATPFSDRAVSGFVPAYLFERVDPLPANRRGGGSSTDPRPEPRPQPGKISSEEPRDWKAIAAERQKALERRRLQEETQGGQQAQGPDQFQRDRFDIPERSSSRQSSHSKQMSERSSSRQSSLSRRRADADEVRPRDEDGDFDDINGDIFKASSTIINERHEEDDGRSVLRKTSNASSVTERQRNEGTVSQASDAKENNVQTNPRQEPTPPPQLPPESTPQPPAPQRQHPERRSSRFVKAPSQRLSIMDSTRRFSELLERLEFDVQEFPDGLASTLYSVDRAIPPVPAIPERFARSTSLEDTKDAQKAPLSRQISITSESRNNSSGISDGGGAPTNNSSSKTRVKSKVYSSTNYGTLKPGRGVEASPIYFQLQRLKIDPNEAPIIYAAVDEASAREGHVNNAIFTISVTRADQRSKPSVTRVSRTFDDFAFFHTTIILRAHVFDFGASITIDAIRQYQRLMSDPEYQVPDQPQLPYQITNYSDLKGNSMLEGRLNLLRLKLNRYLMELVDKGFQKELAMFLTRWPGDE
ncbi:hypothetical protein DFJ73DRAFT_53936 [Zopfochytrium polystomum]|nr:hypothetical protein DFJ73DRAFT_53936 [Zopfochytrium polystomum]